MFNNQNNSSNVRLIYDIMMPSYFPSAVLIKKRWVEEEITSARCLVLFFFTREIFLRSGEKARLMEPLRAARYTTLICLTACVRGQTHGADCGAPFWCLHTQADFSLQPATHTHTLMQKPYPHSYTHTQSDGQDDGV